VTVFRYYGWTFPQQVLNVIFFSWNTDHASDKAATITTQTQKRDQHFLNFLYGVLS
jgi:hypothetical protein